MVPVFRPQTVGIAGVTGQCFPSGKREKKKRPKKKNLLAPYFSTRRRYKTRRDTAGLLVRANESSSSKTLRKGGSERKTQSSLSLSLSRAYRCRAGRLERIRPYLNGSLSLFPSSSSLTTAPPSKHTHTHTSYHTITHILSRQLPAFIISRECVAIFSLGLY